MKPSLAVLFVLLLLILDIALSITIPIVLLTLAPTSPLLAYLTMIYQASGFIALYLALWLVICVIYWIGQGEKRGFSGLPFGIVYRTARLNSWIHKISQASPKTWRIIWNLGVVTGAGLMVFAVYQLGRNLLNLLFRTEQAAAVQLIVPLPGLLISFETFPYLALALSVVLVSHELAHGVASLADGVPLKSTGVLFGHIGVGGFVEPDEEKLNASTNSTKLRIFAAGSFSNFAISMLFLLLLLNFPATIAPFYDTVGTGVRIGSIPANMPAQVAGMRAGDILMSINGTAISGLSDLREYMSRVVPGEDIVITTDRNSYIVRTAADSNNSTRAVIGISDLTNYVLYRPKFPFLSSDWPNILIRTEFWLQLFLVSVAVINMLPGPPFDGDKFLETGLKVLGIKNTKPIRITASFAAWSLLILNLALSGLRFGLFLRV